MSDRFEPARLVADAVLHEGQVLYPYRASSSKNRVRFQFGVLAPKAFCEADSSERSSIRSDLLLEGREPHVQVVARLIQLCSRAVQAVEPSSGEARDVGEMVVGGRRITSFDESIEHEIELFHLPVSELTGGLETSFEFPPSYEVTPIEDEAGEEVGRVTRESARVTARVLARALGYDGPYGLKRLSVTVENVTDWDAPRAVRDEVLRRSLIAVHLLAAVSGGRFCSLIDPPEFAREAAAGCENSGTFPVLASEADDIVLSAPIILYDHPEIAPESVAEFCDATEIDEMLALRVLTLTDEEKAEARSTDPRSAELVDFCDTMPDEILARLHGAVRSLRPSGARTGAEGDTAPDSDTAPGTGTAPDSGPDEPPWWDPGTDASVDPSTDSVSVPGGVASKGVIVRLRPSRRADAQDLFLAGRLATVTGVFRDVDGGEHVAVVLNDDPAAELHEWYGRYLYFHPDEVEACSLTSNEVPQ